MKSHILNYNVLILGGESEIGYQLYNLFKKKNFKVLLSSKKKNNKNNFFYLNYNNLKILKKNLKKKINKSKFDYVLFLAAITDSSKQINNYKCTFGNLNLENFNKILEINCFAPVKIFEILKKNNFLNNNAKIIFFSSLAGSITNRGQLKHNKPFGNILYRVSKAALNCAVKNISYDFSHENIIISIHPGYVRTKNGGMKADISVKHASNKIFKTITSLTKIDNGTFLNYKGNKIKW
jgi:short-subunit dehydrogenase